MKSPKIPILKTLYKPTILVRLARALDKHRRRRWALGHNYSAQLLNQENAVQRWDRHNQRLERIAQKYLAKETKPVKILTS